MTTIMRNFSFFALAAALASCQCGDADPRERGEAAGEAAGASPEREHRALVTPSEVRLDGDTVGDTRALAGEPAGGEVEGLARALEARTERGAGAEILVVEAEADAPAAVIRRVAATARRAGIGTVAFALSGGDAPGRIEPDAPGDEEPILTVEVGPDEIRVIDGAGKTWTIPKGGPRGGRKVLVDVLRARKEAPDLRDRDDLKVVVEAEAGYGALFDVLDAAAASGFDRPHLVAPDGGAADAGSERKAP